MLGLWPVSGSSTAFLGGEIRTLIIKPKCVVRIGMLALHRKRRPLETGQSKHRREPANMG